MASKSAPVPVDAAEKAYAAAAESLTEKSVAVEASAAPFVEPVAAPAVEPVATPVEAPVTEVLAVDVTMPPKARRAPKAAPVKEQAPMPVAAKPVARAKVPARKKPVARAVKPVAANPVSRPATLQVAKPVSLKDKTMTTKTMDINETVKTAFANAQAKAREGYTKGSELVGEAVEFTKGNVEAVVESGKILIEGSKKLGETYVAEAKGAYETVNADLKSMAAVKSPVELVKLQGEIATRNFEQAIELTKKNSEAWMKLATEAFAPLQGRFTLAVEKIRKAA